MSQIEIAGLAVLGMAAVLGLFGMFLKLIVTPVNNLTVSVTELNSTLDMINKEQAKLESMVNSNAKAIAKVQIAMASHGLKK